jgi:hypothetical protein
MAHVVWSRLRITSIFQESTRFATDFSVKTLDYAAFALSLWSSKSLRDFVRKSAPPGQLAISRANGLADSSGSAPVNPATGHSNRSSRRLASAHWYSHLMPAASARKMLRDQTSMTPQ